MLNKIFASLPQQVDRQQPVMFLDALGRLSPIHLEWINSKEAFLAVLKVRFKNLGLRKVEKGEFALQETKSRRDLDLSVPWEVCFFPGQIVDMSMVFRQSHQAKLGSCPACKQPCSAVAGEDVEW